MCPEFCSFAQLRQAILLACTPCLLIAQSAPPPSNSSNEGPITLSAFEVQTTASVGYGAQVSNSSSRLNLRYIDVPQTLSVVTSEFLEDAHIFDSREFVKYTNNITPRANTHQPETFFVRGIQISDTYVDGFLTSLAVNRDSALYDRVEYVKGPASAAIGRGEAGGLVNFITKRPLKTQRNSYKVIVGTDSFYRGEFDHNGVITRNGSVSYRIPLYYQESDGTRGGDLMQLKKRGIGPSLLWEATPRTQVSVSSGFFRYDGPGAVGEAYWSQPDMYRYQLDLGQLVNSDWNPFDNPLVSHELVYGFPGRGRVTDVSEISALATHRFSDRWSFRQAVRWNRMDEELQRFNVPSSVRRNPANPNDFLLSVNYLHDFRTHDGYRAQGDLLFDLNSDFAHHKFLAGYEYSDSSSTNRRGNRGGLTQSLYSPDYTYPAGFHPDTYITTFTTDTASDGKGFGYYGQYFGSYFRDRINLMIAWRQDRTESESLNRRNNVVTSTGKQTTDVPRYSISYKPTQDMSIYYVHSRQQDPQVIRSRYSVWTSIAGSSVPPPSDPRYDERFVSQIQAELDEVGVKAALFNNRVTAAVSIYSMNRSGFVLNDVQTLPSHDGTGFYQVGRNYSVTGERIRGVELELFGQPTDRLTIFAGYGTQSGQKPRNDGVLTPVESLIDSGTIHLKYDWRDRNRNGFQLTAGGKYWFSGWALWQGTNVTFRDDQYNIDAGVSYSWRNGSYTVGVRANNLTDQFVYLSPNSQWDLRRILVSFSGSF